MTYAIIGLGKIGSAIAQAFARKEIEVTVAGRRPPELLAARGADRPVACPAEHSGGSQGRHCHPGRPVRHPP